MAQAATNEGELAARLAHGAERAEHLVALLGEEHDALATGRPEAIDAATRSKETLVAELERLGALLAEALRVIGVEAPDDLHERLERAPASPVASSVRRLLDALAQCRQANARNGAAVRQLARHNHHLLSLLRGETPGATLYDNDGRARTGPLTRYAASA